jgi:hypothetical protein
MSYERDTDNVTRGVGAIAAADHVSPDRHKRRVQAGRDLRRRDHAMSSIAQGALGMTSLPSDGSTSTTKVGTTIRPLPAGAVRAIVSGRIVAPAAPAPAPVRVIPPNVRLPPTSIPTGPVIAKDPGTGSVIVPVVPVVPPTTTLPLPPGTTNKPPWVYTGGGGSTGTGNIAPATSPPLIGASQVPEIQDATASDDHTTRNVLIMAAGAGAITYFLFFRRAG